MRHFLRAVALLLASPLLAGAQDQPHVFAGRVIPIAGPEIPNGVVVIERGKIVAVGPEGTTKVPSGAIRHDLSGKVLMPGLVDTHSHIGDVAGADASAPIQPDVRVIDAINLRHAGFQKAQAGGLTTVNIMPGSGHLLSGQTLYVKLREGKVSLEDLVVTDANGMTGGIKMANGTNSRRKAPFPGTRAKSAALVREQFVKAQEYRKKIKDSAGDTKKAPARDLGLEALVEVLDGKRVVHHHTHRHDDVLTVLRLSKEFGFRVVIHHVSDAWMVADQIAAAKVPSSIIFVDSPGGKLETLDLSWKNGAALEKAGALVGIHTDDYITDSRLFLRSAGLAVRAGMSREKALEAVTLAGARMLSLDQRVGSLEAGKDADLVVLSGDPLSYKTHVLETWVEGLKVFDRGDPKDRLYATGGYGASHDQSPFAHLDGDEEEGR